MALVAIGRGRQEMLAARLDPFHRASDAARDSGQQNVLGIDVTLGAEAAADVRRDHAHSLLGEAQGRGDRGAHGERYLGRRPDRQPAVRSVGLHQHAAWLDRHRGHARHAEARLDDHVRLAEAAGDVADDAVGWAGHVVGPLVEDPRRVCRERGVDRGHRGQHVVANVDELGGVGGPIHVVGDHHRHGLAGVAGLRAGDCRLGVGPEPGRRHERRHCRGALRQLGTREDGDHTRLCERPARVDSGDASVRVGTAHDRRVQEVGKAQIVDVATASREKAAIFATLDGQADGRAHEIVVKVVAV